MEYCIRSMGIPEFCTFQTQTGLDLRKTRDPPQDIMSLLGELWSHGRVRSIVLSRSLVRNQSIEPWNNLYARSCGYVSY